ncbi:MAG: TRAP transporter small permease [Proteobacteria bacterium]|nr:TRAP transporter small permease [Pseudomonadota bacterium]
MTRLADTVDRLLGVCERVFHALANACLAIMLALNIANILVRGLSDRGIVWVFPWTMVLFVWMSFFGFFVLYRKNRDITVDFLIDRLGPSGKLVARLLVNAIVLVLMTVMLWHAPRVIAQQTGAIEMVFFLGMEIERYALSVPLFTSCALIFITFCVDTVQALMGRPQPAHHVIGDM